MKCLHRALLLTLLMTASLSAAQEAPLPIDDLAQGLWWLYQLRYDKATELYEQHISSQPADPAGYFYEAAADWWHLAQDFEFHHPDLEKRFEANVDLTIEKSKNQLDILTGDSPEKVEQKALCYLYWGGAEGLRGRWLVTQRHWAKAYFSGKDGFEHLKKAVALNPMLYDAYMGIGIYDYFSDTLSGFMGFLSSVFVRGDRKRGIAELQVAIDKSPNASVESRIFLAEIYIFEEKNPDRAMALITELRTEYPHSPLMHLLQITAFYHAQDWPHVTLEAQNYLSQSEAQTPWYTHEGIAPALYCLAVADLWGKRDKEKALATFNRIINQADPRDPSRWISFAYLRRGQIEDLNHERPKALKDYQTVLQRPGMWGSHHEARAYISEPFVEN